VGRACCFLRTRRHRHHHLLVRSLVIVVVIVTGRYTDQLPGGPLQVNVYAGADATFTHVEDDGETTAYKTTQTQAGQVRSTTYTWSDAAKTLSWSVDGTFTDSHVFTELQAVAFFKGATQVS
jgi:alpha-glucosidase